MSRNSGEAAGPVRVEAGPAPSAGVLVDYLQRVGERYREHAALLRERQALDEMRECTFRPVVSAHAEESARASAVRGAAAIEERLHELHARKLARLEELRAAQERAAAAAAERLTFQPQITARAAELERSGTLEDAMRRWEAGREARRAQLAAEARARETAEVGGPHISAYARLKAERERRPGEAVEDSMRARDEAARQRKYALVELSRAAAPDPSPRGHRLPFTPRVSLLASSLEPRQDVVERLYQPRAHDDASRCYDPEMAEHCTFRPAVSPASRELSRLHRARAPGESLYERLYRDDPRRRPRADPEAPSFAPQISETSRIMAETRRVCQEPVSPATRMHLGLDSSRRPPPPAEDAAAAADLTFHPALNSTSEELWERRVGELARGGVRPAEAREAHWREASERQARRAEEQRRAREEAETAECTFQPRTGRSPRRVSGEPGMSVEERARVWEAQRRQRLARLRAEAEEEAAAQLTFRPQVEDSFPLPRDRGGPIRGADSFLERQRAAQRRREEDQQWWRPSHARRRGSPYSPEQRGVRPASAERTRASAAAGSRPASAAPRVPVLTSARGRGEDENDHAAEDREWRRREERRGHRHRRGSGDSRSHRRHRSHVSSSEEETVASTQEQRQLQWSASPPLFYSDAQQSLRSRQPPPPSRSPVELMTSINRRRL